MHVTVCIDSFATIIDLLVAKSTCSAINKLMQSSGQGVRLPNDHSIFNQIAFVLTSNFKNLETSQWIPLCEQGVTLVYQLSEQPNAIGEVLLRDLSQLTNLEGNTNSLVKTNSIVICIVC